MNRFRIPSILFITLLLVLLLAACGGQQPATIGIKAQELGERQEMSDLGFSIAYPTG